MSETLSMHLNLLETLLVAMQTIFRPYFHDPVSLTELAACLSFDVRKVSFRAREALCVQGALQLKT